jgi:hypothetical protein
MKEALKGKLKEKAAATLGTTSESITNLDTIASLISADTAIKTAESIKFQVQQSLEAYDFPKY